ncbi:MAG: hypothetical protein MPJ50_02365 [Pirellulales bacterium]|nr:hypothetical protein [Pirellulales bacterium]
MSKVSATLAALFALLNAPALQADITWVVTYNDVVNNTNIGFDDPTLGATRRSTALAVFDYINTVVDEDGTAEVRFNNSQDDGSGFLASAGPFFFTTPGFTNGLLFQHAKSGIDPTGLVPDAQATVDFGWNWNDDLGAPALNEFDLFSVLLHEITHTMGYLSLLDASGNGAGSGDVFSVYDSFLERGNGTQLFSGTNFVGNASDLTSGDLFFDGPESRALNNNQRLEIFAPNPFDDGSSVSHLDGTTHPNALMNPAIASGVAKRVFSSEDLGVLSDIGWTLKAIPEPSTMTIWGVLGATAIWARYRRRRPV